MAGFTRTHGANAEARSWEDFLDDERPQPTGSWLPLEALDNGYEQAPLRPVPGTRRGPLTARDIPAESRPTARHPQQPQAAPRPSERAAAAATISVRGIQVRAVAMLAGAAIAALALYVAVSAAVEWTQMKADDLQYGRPRTVQLDAYVGHDEAAGVPTHFVAMNLNRRVTVLELPGGDSAKATAIVGPYLFGDGEDLTPVQVAAQDVNNDSKPDLVLTVKNEQLLYLNDGTNFKLVTPEERAALLKAQAGAQVPAGPDAGAAPAQEAGK